MDIHKFLIVIICAFLLGSTVFGQSASLLYRTNDGFSLRVEFNGVVSELRHDNNVQIMSFPEAIDESNPGTPALPSKTFFIAIPPNTKISAELSNVKKQNYSNVEPVVNPKIVFSADSSLSRQPVNLNTDRFIGDRYPASDVEVTGYTWLGNYYCVIVKVNTHVYYLNRKEITELRSADLQIRYQQPQLPFKKNFAPLSQYERDLKEIILNYNEAQEFRSFRSPSFAPDTSDSWIDYTKQYVKLAVPADGIYRITYNNLLSDYGVNPAALNPQTLRLFEGGKEQPIYVYGEEDGVFDTGDYIEFYGTKHYGSKKYRSIVKQGEDYLNYMDRYSDTTIVWLTWGGGAGIRTSRRDASGVSTDTVQSSLMRIHLEKDVQLWYYDVVDPRTQLPFWQEHKIWSWQFFNPGRVINIGFTASSVVPGTLCTPTFRFIANGTDQSQSSSKVGIGFNSTSITAGDTFAYRQTVNFQNSYSSALLKEGANSIRVQAMTGGTFQFLLDWVDIDYYRFTKAVGDSIFITIPDSVTEALRIIKVTGLTVPNPLIYKVNPGQTKIINYSISGGSSKTCLFADTVSGGDRYYVVTESKVKTPLFVVKKTFPNLRSTDRGADYVIVSNKLLSASVMQYNNFITSQYGIRTQAAYVDDIFDEFSFGYNYPEAIKDFLIRANTLWQSPAPTYLMLIGEANYDYKNATTVVSQIKPNLVPSYGYPVSDVWYATWDSSQVDIPQMYVGRIPAKSDADVNFYLQKHQEYLQKPFDEWNKTFLFLSGGDPGTPGQIDQIRNANNSVYTTLALSPPVGGIGKHFYKTTNPVSNFGPYTQQEVQNTFQTGSLLISYIGHSGTQTWDNGINAVSELKNIYSNRFPLISDFGCSTGKFAEPDIDCFGELFISEDRNGQAISYLGNSSLGYLATSVNFPQLFYGKILKDTVTAVGTAHLLSKIQQLQNMGSSPQSRVFNYCNLLFGDPIINLALPRKPNFVLNNQSVSLKGNVPTETDDSVAVSIVTQNLGRVPPDSVKITLTDKQNGNTVFAYSYKISPSRFWDTTVVKIPVRNQVGEHTITVMADSTQSIQEMDETDNTAIFPFVVYSTTLRSLEQNSYYNAAKNSIVLINPVYKINGTEERIRFSLDTTEAFLTPVEFTKEFDTVATEVILPSLVEGKRYWWRVKIDEPEFDWSTPSSFVNINSAAQWLAESPRATNDFFYDNTHFNQQGKTWELFTGFNRLRIASAGFSDGSFASVEYNGGEKLANTFFWGIVTAKIDTNTLQPSGFQYFLTSNGTAQEQTKAADSLTRYVNSLVQGEMVAISICTDGTQSVLGSNAPTTVRNAIKQLGSYYIDSVKYRESWCIIGKKGAPIGSVPESYKRLFGGVASVTMSINTRPDSGAVLFPSAGDASLWDSLTFNSVVPPGTKIVIVPLGLKSETEIDTLSPLIVNSTGSASLSHIPASNYPDIKLLAKFYANTNKETPNVGNVALYYEKPPELALNYQVVGTYKADRVIGTDSVFISQIKSDTVVQGKYLGVHWRIYNISQTTAKNVKVQSTVIWDNNYREELGSVTFDSLPPGNHQDMKLLYNSSAGTGTRHFQVVVDPDNAVRELYKDNNSYSTAFVVVPDSVPPPLPNLAVDSKSIFVPSNIPDTFDSTAITIVVRNTGSARYDSVDLLVRQNYQSAIIKTWNIRIHIPVLSDTVVLYADVKGKAGEHQINVEIDPLSKIIESSKEDNSASKNFFVATTEFTILQPDRFNTSYIPQLILLNPSAEPWDGVKKILLDVDTENNFLTATHFNAPMGQFSTFFDISMLKRSTRYWWRAKVEHGAYDWTVGTFFLGDSMKRTVGQADSVAWSGNIFLHASYSNRDGAKIEDSPERFRLVSAGIADGGFGAIEFNGTNLITNTIDTCHFLAVFDSNYNLISVHRFNLFSDPAQSDLLAAFLTAVPDGYYVVAVIIGEGSNNFTSSARNAYGLIGSKDAGLIGWRDSWAIIGRKGAAIGSVPEIYRASSTGKVELDTTYFRYEAVGTITTEKFGPINSWGNLTVESTIPIGSSVHVAVIGMRKNGSTDTIASALNPENINLQNVVGSQYPYGKLLFTLYRSSSGVSPSVRQWTLTAQPPPELATSQRAISVEKTVMYEGEINNLAMKIFNVGGIDADSITIAILTDDSGFPRVLQQTVIPFLGANDSATIQTQYDSRGKQGDHAFFFRVDPDSTLQEVTKTNNSFTVEYTIIADTLKPQLTVTFDGVPIVDGDYVSQRPVVMISYKDNSPALITPADSSNFTLRFNNSKGYFISGDAEFVSSPAPGETHIRWTPLLDEGENFIRISALDVSGNYSDTLSLYVSVSSTFQLKDVYNLPNPFNRSTHFTFNLAGPVTPDEAIIKLYTVAGRLIHEIHSLANVGFNKIFWDGRDKDGDEIGNGVYLYRIIVKGQDKQATATSKLVKMK